MFSLNTFFYYQMLINTKILPLLLHNLHRKDIILIDSLTVQLYINPFITNGDILSRLVQPVLSQASLYNNGYNLIYSILILKPLELLMNCSKFKSRTRALTQILYRFKGCLQGIQHYIVLNC
jgi:hypothetical protein